MGFGWQNWMIAIIAPLIVLAVPVAVRFAVFALYNWKARDWWDIVLGNTYEKIAGQAEKSQRSQLEQDEREIFALSGGTGWIAGDPLTLIPLHLVAIRKRLDTMRLESDIQNHWVRTVAPFSTAQIVWLWFRKLGQPPGSLSTGETRRFLDPLHMKGEDKGGIGGAATDPSTEPPARSAAAGTAAGRASPPNAPLAGVDAIPAPMTDVPIVLTLIQTLERVAALRAGGYLDQEEYQQLKQRLFITFSVQDREGAPESVTSHDRKATRAS